MMTQSMTQSNTPESNMSERDNMQCMNETKTIQVMPRPADLVCPSTVTGTPFGANPPTCVNGDLVVLVCSEGAQLEFYDDPIQMLHF